MGFGSLGSVGGGGGGGSAAPWSWDADVYADFDFAGQRGFQGAVQGSPGAFFISERNAIAYAESAATDSVTQFAALAPRITDAGWYLEPSRTNLVLWNRDLTNAAWVKAGANPPTAALDQTGMDGVVNGASSLTQTVGGGVGTALQAITDASKARYGTVYTWLVSGTGTLEMTLDNGATWVDISPASSVRRRKYYGAQTLANPTVGFRITQTSGTYKVGIDFAQCENGSAPTSPIAVTTVAVTRPRDTDGQFLLFPPFGSSFSFLMKAKLLTVGATRIPMTGQGTTNNRYVDMSGTNNTFDLYNGSVLLSATAGSGGWLTGAKVTSCHTPSGRSCCMNGGTVTSDANLHPIPTSLFMLDHNGPGDQMLLQRLSIWNNSSLSSTKQQAYTTL